MAESVTKLLEVHFFALGPGDEWEKFRQTIIWNYDVSDILEANDTGLRKIWNSFVTPRRRQPSKDDMVRLMCKSTIPPILKAEVDAIYCYGMCKMAVVLETNDKHHIRYDQIQYVEFLEFLCRCAEIKYKEDEDGEIDICQKLKDLLDELLPAFNVQRKEVELINEELSESDDDY